MIKTRSLAGSILGLALVATTALAQEAGRSEVSVQALGSFVKSTTDKGVEQGATNSGGVLANYRFFFSNSHGVEVNYGYSRNSQTYGLSTGLLGVKSDQHEITAAYVYRHALRNFTPFVEAGVGALLFDPTDLPGVSTQARAAFVYGGGADFNITRRLFARVQYRGFVYNSPTFDLVSTVGTDRITHRAEPSVGFGYRF
jgi:outer membrane immunogenic protein